jgi:NADH-quinone oxidoreductase subunit J
MEFYEILFWVFAAVMSVSAIRVVTSRNVVHAALYLLVVLAGAAVIFLLFTAEFVGWVQVLIYVGAVVVLLLFGLMLTRAPIGKGSFDNDQRPLAAVCALAVFVVSSVIMIDAFRGQEVDFTREAGTTSEQVGNAIFSDFVLPFEVVSVLLLAALVGAVVIARRDEEGAE